MFEKGYDMKKTLFTALPIFVLTFFLASCAKTVIPEEILLLPEYTSVYTAYNLWARPSLTSKEIWGNSKTSAKRKSFGNCKNSIINM